MLLETLYFSKILYFFTLLILTAGLFIMLSSDNYVRKIIGLSVMQSSVLIFYLILGKVNGGIIPIERNSNEVEVQQLDSSSQKGINSLEPQAWYHTFFTEGTFCRHCESAANQRGSLEKIIKLSYLYRFCLDCHLDLQPTRNDDRLRGHHEPQDVPQAVTYQYSSPVPQVLMLTAIVVGFATLSVGLALIYLISERFSTICESKIPESQVHFKEMG